MRHSFILSYNLQEQCKKLSDEQFGKLMRSVFAYVIDAEVPTFNDELDVYFGFIKAELDSDIARYEEKCKRRAENAQNGRK